MVEESLRQRAKRQLIQVTFPSGKVICCANVTNTFIAVLNEIGTDRFEEIKLEVCHRPLISREVYPEYKDWMKPICEGWYLFSQSDTRSKYLQLASINNSLGLDLKIEVGHDFEVVTKPSKPQKTKSKDKLLVKLPNGEYVAGDNPIDTFLQTCWELGIDEIRKKNLSWGGEPLVTTYKSNNRQVQVNDNKWLAVPNTTKDKVKLLRTIAAMMRITLEITVV